MPADLTGAPTERPLDVVAARNLCKSFGQTTALTGASLAVAEREIVAIMGPSGSGKSTLLHCMAGILLPESGEVWLAGRRLDTMKDTARTEVRRREFGFVFQFGQLVPELTAEENVALPLLLNGGRRAAAIIAARGWLGRVGLEGLGQRRSGELSGGQAQRVAVARALVSGPRVLFADEPTGSLDSVTGELVMELLVGIARTENTTLVLVTHEPWVAGYADRIATVHDGQVVSTSEQVPS